MSGITVTDCITVIEDALAIVAKKSKEALKINLTKADVELSMIATDEVGGKIKFDLILSVDLGGKIESSNSHVLSLSLRPKGGVLKLGGPQATELAEAIFAIAAAIHDANLTIFRVDEASVEVKFVVASQGKLKVLFGLGTKAENTHSIKLTFQPDI